MQTVKPCFVRLVRLKPINSSQGNAKSTLKGPPQRIPTLTKKEIRCPICNKMCKYNSKLETHIRVHTGERPFACTICKQRFKTQEHLRRHSSTLHTDNRPFPCLWCGESFKTNVSFIQHLRMHIKEKPHFCKKCPDGFSSWDALTQHAFSKHNSGKEKKKCEYCPKMFYRNSELNRHKRIHAGEKPYSCSVCGKCFGQKSTLVQHSRVHTEIIKFNCTECPKAFRFKSNLTAHILNVHEKVRNYSCGICGKTYFSKASRHRHINSHVNEKAFLCPKCPRRFAHRNSLAYHLKAFHENIKDFKCSECPNTFVDKSSLGKHFLGRHGLPSERPHACLFCSKRYCSPSKLENHLRSHLGEKPHFCDLCSYSSGTSSDLAKHVRRIHTSRSN